MTPPLACLMCALDPATTNMLVPMAQATVIAVPFFFRNNIKSAIRRARGLDVEDLESEFDDEDCDTPPDDDLDGSQPPGAVRP
jgi:hypothetical protein